jgi:DNA-binding SARP family transcriptional activator
VVMPTMTGSVLDCRVLGPLQVDCGGVEVPVAGHVAGRVLAALSTTAGVPMGDEVLAEVVWGDDLPAKVAHSLRVAVCRLRGKLGPDCVLRTPGGYAFSIPAERLDHHRFVELVSTGLRCQREQDARGAVRAFESALRLWRGRPWPELGEAELVTLARMRLEELRLVAVEELQAARLVTGDIGTALAALREAVADTPYRERRWELLATCLCASGQPTRALSELRRVRRLLADDLGIDPGPALQALERRIQPTSPRHPPTWRWRQPIR